MKGTVSAAQNRRKEPQRRVAGPEEPGPGVQQQVVERRAGVGQQHGPNHAAWTGRGSSCSTYRRKDDEALGVRPARRNRPVPGSASAAGCSRLCPVAMASEKISSPQTPGRSASTMRSTMAAHTSRTNDHDERVRTGSSVEDDGDRIGSQSTSSSPASARPSSSSAAACPASPRRMTLARAGVRRHRARAWPSLGGLAGSFEREGHFYPLGYHHILHRDRVLLYFLDLIGALPDVRWRRVRMLFHLGGRAYDLGITGRVSRVPDVASAARRASSA